MILVLGLSALVVGAVGALLGALAARYLPKALLFVVWAALLAGAAYQFLQSRSLDEYERAGSDVVVFTLLLPLLIGSLITGSLVRRKQT